MVFQLGPKLRVLLSFFLIEDLDLSSATNYVLASPFSADFVVDGDGSGALSVSAIDVISLQIM
jgi:hypothetical protein